MTDKNLEAGVPPPSTLLYDLKKVSTSEKSDMLGAIPIQTELGEVANIEVTDEQNRRVLRKTDQW